MILRISSLWRRTQTHAARPGARPEAPSATDRPLRRSPHVRTARQGDEAALFDLRGERYFALNEVGSRVWELLAPGATRREIVAVIRREYAMPPMPSAGDGTDAVDADVARLLAELLDAGLVVDVAAHQPASEVER